MDCLIRFFSKKLGYVPSRDPALKRVRPDFQAGPGCPWTLEILLGAPLQMYGCTQGARAGRLCFSDTPPFPQKQLASPSTGDLDSELRASGFKREHQAALDRWVGHPCVHAGSAGVRCVVRSPGLSDVGGPSGEGHRPTTPFTSDT